MTVLVKTRYGEMECLAGDSIVSKALALYGEWAQLELDVLQKLVQPGAVVLDVGAFLGTHTLAFARMVGEQGKVISFEPREAIRRLLSANVNRNGLRHVAVESCALGAGKAAVSIPALDIAGVQNFGGLAIEEAAGDQGAQVERIAVRPLDDFALGRVDFIKIDAEGMEADVLAGARRTLAEHRPVVFAECNDLRNGGNTLNAFLEAGYAVYGVLSEAFNPDNYNHVAENIFFGGSEASLLAVPQERLTSLAVRLDLSAFPGIDSLDALALLLLHKPQYPDEVLATTSAAAVLGVEFPSPLARRIEAVIEAQSEEIVNAKTARGKRQTLVQRLEGELAGLRASLMLLEAERADALRVKQRSARYRSTSVAYWWERLSGRRAES